MRRFLTKRNLLAAAALALFAVGTAGCVLTGQCQVTDGNGVEVVSNKRFLIDLFLDQLSQ